MTPALLDRRFIPEGGTTTPVFEAPIDGWYVWSATALASLAICGVAMSVPTAPPPDATAAANSIDSFAGAPHNATGEHPISADAIDLSPHVVALRGPGGVARERLSYGPVTPVADEGRLARVLSGAPPGRVFENPAELRRAASRARQSETGWESTVRVRIRTVVWRGVHVTLVGA